MSAVAKVSKRVGAATARHGCWMKAIVPMLIAAAIVATASAAADKTTLASVLARAGTYVEQFQRELSGIAAEESYVQEVVPAIGSNTSGTVQHERRMLRSDLVLLRPG